MSKKETRRAARQAFPKLKSPPPAKSAYGARPRPQGASRGKAPVRMVPKPPNVKRSAIWGVVMGIGYFLVIQFVWKATNTTLVANVIVAAVCCFIFAAVVFFTDRYKYQRYLRKKSSSSK